jgi:uncharacterized Ntn-hydrolase superfamily protein
MFRKLLQTDNSKNISLFIIVIIFLTTLNAFAQDTFSICAVDPVSGQVGSAGATCISSSATSAIIISDVHPGVGVIHTQASYLSINQVRARGYMNLGWTPQQIVDSIVAHDWQSNPSIRQYGVVTLDSGGRSAAYTGINCMDYKNHITGPTYSIQGNILLGQQILDSIQSRFLNTNGNLACKLMAALQGAKVVGADSRCAPNGISTFSAFIRVANPNDSAGHFFLDLTVNTYPNHIEPIDTLQTLFDIWGGCAASFIPTEKGNDIIKYFPDPVSDLLHLESPDEIHSIQIFNFNGKQVRTILPVTKTMPVVDMSGLEPGIYFIRMGLENSGSAHIKIVKTS